MQLGKQRDRASLVEIRMQGFDRLIVIVCDHAKLIIKRGQTVVVIVRCLVDPHDLERSSEYSSENELRLRGRSGPFEHFPVLEFLLIVESKNVQMLFKITFFLFVRNGICHNSLLVLM